MESDIPSAWVPRDSDRIWRGSYKGKVRVARWLSFKLTNNWK